MTLKEVVDALIWWLSQFNMAFAVSSVKATDETHFAIVIHELFPKNTMRSFHVESEECADCWKMTEQAA